MGHDYIDFGTSHLRLNDFDIWTLRHFLIDTLAASTPASLGTDSNTLDELFLFIQSWQWLGPGIVIGCDFNTFVTSPSRMHLVRRMFSEARDRIEAFGTSIPLDYLEKQINSPMAYYLDAQPVSRFVNIVDRLLALIPEAGNKALDAEPRIGRLCSGSVTCRGPVNAVVRRNNHA